MIAIKKIVGCIYDEKGRLINLIHWDEETRRPVLYKVEALGLDEAVDIFNYESPSGTTKREIRKPPEDQKRNPADGSDTTISSGAEQGTGGNQIPPVVILSRAEKIRARFKRK